MVQGKVYKPVFVFSGVAGNFHEKKEKRSWANFFKFANQYCDATFRCLLHILICWGVLKTKTPRDPKARTFVLLTFYASLLTHVYKGHFTLCYKKEF